VKWSGCCNEYRILCHQTSNLIIILTAVNVPFLEIIQLLISCIIIIITLILICIILRYTKNELSSGSVPAFLKQEV
jgi:hypothetical protein